MSITMTWNVHHVLI